MYTNGQANFYQNGGVNIMKEMSALAHAKQSMGKEEFDTFVSKVFGKNSELAESMLDWMKHATDGQIKEMAEMNHAQLNQNYMGDEHATKTGNENMALVKTNWNAMGADATTYFSRGLSSASGWLASASGVGADAVHAEKDLSLLPGAAIWHYLYKKSFGDSSALSGSEENAASPEIQHASSSASSTPETARQATPAAPRDIRDSDVQAAYIGGKAVENPHAAEANREADAERQKSIAENYLAQMGQMLDSFAERIKPYVNAAVYVDGKEVASRLVSNYSMGTTGMNGSAAFYGFGSGSIGYLP